MDQAQAKAQETMQKVGEVAQQVQETAKSEAQKQGLTPSSSSSQGNQQAQQRARRGSIIYYESIERFIDQVSRVVELGISDVGLYYPLDLAQHSTFERIATDVLPGSAPRTHRRT